MFTMEIFHHGVRVNKSAMERELASCGMHTQLVGEVITRGQLFELAPGARDSDGGALYLLWNTLAWGTGRANRANLQPIREIAKNPGEIGWLLKDAAVRATEDPAAAYKMLRSGGRNRIKYLGPSLFTKYLYFAGGGYRDHPCQILDTQVAAGLRQLGWSEFKNNNWRPGEYADYCHQVRDWATAIGAPRRDLIEKGLSVLAG